MRVPPAGFAPAIPAMKGLPPGPLDVVGACQAHLFILRVPGATMHRLDEYVTTSRQRGYWTPRPRAEPARVPADARGRQRRVGARHPGGGIFRQDPNVSG